MKLMESPRVPHMVPLIEEEVPEGAPMMVLSNCGVEAGSGRWEGRSHGVDAGSDRWEGRLRGVEVGSDRWEGRSGDTKVAADGVADDTTIGAINGALGDTAGATDVKIIGAIDGSWTKGDNEGGGGAMALFNTKFIHLPKAFLQNKKGHPVHTMIA
jgi:hypothetical protein